MDRTREPQEKIGWISVNDYQNIITNNQIINTQVTANDINRAEDIYGSIVVILKVTMVRKRPQHIQNIPRVPLPSLILDHHKT